jgi:periplasmic glucans biosynthesis protein
MLGSTRRQVLAGIAATAAIGRAGAAWADGGLQLGDPAPFSFDILKETARRIADAPYAPPTLPSPEIVGKIVYETWGKIAFNTSYALFAEGPNRFPATFFHLGKFFPKPVRMHAVRGDEAREIIFDPRYFLMPEDSPARQLPKGSGFAGVRIQEARDGALDWRKNDWAAFLGASYFRAIGELHQYGASARGIALDTAVAGRLEEFPEFTNFYIAEPESGDTVVVYALLEGPSLAGACKFAMTRGKGVIMDIEQALFVRRAVSRFGVAPLTSMYWFSETKKPTAVDWRPEVHDSDGLAMWTGRGERLWRPLNNPPHVVVSAFADETPKGFGLLQRDRVFDHYLDGVFYDHRPSLWVEPRGSWGKGAVQLIELPTDDEIHDNIVALWVPEAPPEPGSELTIAYTLHWLADEPYPTDLARCVATRLGMGGQPGQPRPDGVRKFLVEFLGGPLANLPYGVKPEMVLDASRGVFTDYRIMEPVPDGIPGHWRAQFDLADVRGTDPVEMRLQLAVNNKIATETWLFQYHPF